MFPESLTRGYASWRFHINSAPALQYIGRIYLRNSGSDELC